MWCGRAFSYNDTKTHPALTDNAIRIYNANFERQLNSQEINWIIKGSIEEDNLPRPANHFFEPFKGIGIAGFASSKIWVQNGGLQKISTTGDYSWQTAISAYSKGDNKLAFMALGHILHLLEDKAVPAHTRLDEHLTKSDPYEQWAEKQTNVNFNTSPIIVGQLNDAFDRLALYSNKYFLSKNTLDIENKNKEEKLINGKFYLFSNEINGKKFKIAEKIFISKNQTVLTLSDEVHSDYFSLLAPKAIAYSSGVIKLFIDEAERAKKEYEQKSWWQKLKEGFLSSISSSLTTGLPSNLIESIVPSPASQEAINDILGGREEPASQENYSSSYSLPENTIETRDKIIVELPANTVSAQENLGGFIAEEATPSKTKIPPSITEEIDPAQVALPSPSPLSFLPGIGGAPVSESSSDSDSETDATAPQTTITSAPAAAVATTTAVFVFEPSESNSTFLCSLDNATSTICDSPKEYNDLASGSHNFKVSAKDAAGNEDASPAEHSWNIDLTAPSLSNISSAPTRTSAAISWASDEVGIFQVEYGTSTSYGLLSATTSAATMNLISLEIETTYHYRLLAQDSVANATTTIDYTFTTSNQAESVVISEIQIGGATATDEFVELYNPTGADINLEGWKLAHRLSSATSSYDNLLSSFPSKVIPARGYFLVVHPTGYDGAVPADETYSSASYSLAANHAIILYSDQGDTIVDLVGLGTALSFEGAATDSPADDYSVERKSCSTSTAATLYSGGHKWQGNGYDSDNNSQDFVLQTVSAPQNSLMLSEPRSVLPNLATSSAWPVWQKNLARDGQAMVISLASSTVSVKWTATTTATQGFLSRLALDSSGNIYIGRANGLAKYSLGGEFLWLFATSTSYSAPLILNDDSIIFRGAWGLFAVNSQGQQKWKYSLSGSAANNSPPIILSDGTIITQSAEKIYAINQDATLKWIFDPGRAMSSSDSFTAPVVDATDNIYLVLDNFLYAIDKNGAKLWERNDGSYSGLAMGDNNAIYISYKSVWPNGGFLALDKNSGNILWQDENGYNNLAYLAPAVDDSGKVFQIMFYGNGDKKLRMYNASSTPSWSTNLASANLAAPILTSDGKIYVADQKTFKIFDTSDGALLTSFNTGDGQDIYNFFGAAGSDGVIYMANGNILYAIDD